MYDSYDLNPISDRTVKNGNKLFKPEPISGGDGDIGVQTETRDDGAAWTGRTVYAFGIDTITANRHPSSSLRPRGDASGDGSGIDLRQPRLIARQPIGLLLIQWRRAGAAARQQGGNALGQQLGQLPHFTVLRGP